MEQVLDTAWPLPLHTQTPLPIPLPPHTPPYPTPPPPPLSASFPFRVQEASAGLHLTECQQSPAAAVFLCNSILSSRFGTVGIVSIYPHGYSYSSYMGIVTVSTWKQLQYQHGYSRTVPTLGTMSIALYHLYLLWCQRSKESSTIFPEKNNVSM